MVCEGHCTMIFGIWANNHITPVMIFSTYSSLC